MQEWRQELADQLVRVLAAPAGDERDAEFDLIESELARLSDADQTDVLHRAGWTT